jgi:DNA-directed RNA polymerase sigma subunit (sigma70/sigma32)
MKQQERLLSFPTGAIRTLNKIGEVESELGQQLRREPSLEEAAEAVGISPGELRLLICAAELPISMDGSLRPDEAATLHELIGQPEREPVFESERQELLRRISYALSGLDPFEKLAVMLTLEIELFEIGD